MKASCVPSNVLLGTQCCIDSSTTQISQWRSISDHILLMAKASQRFTSYDTYRTLDIAGKPVPRSEGNYRKKY